MMTAEDTTRVTTPVGPLLAFLACPGLLAGALGAYPTWRLVGSAGLVAMAWAGVAVFVGMFATGCALLWRSDGRVDRIAPRFAGASVFRVSMCLALAAAAWYILGLPTNVLFVWTGLFYVVMLIGESCWLVRFLKRQAKECGSPRS